MFFKYTKIMLNIETINTNIHSNRLFVSEVSADLTEFKLFAEIEEFVDSKDVESFALVLNVNSFVDVFPALSLIVII